MGSLCKNIGFITAKGSNSPKSEDFKVKFEFENQIWNDSVKAIIEKGIGLSIEEFSPQKEYPHDTNLGNVWKSINTYCETENINNPETFCFIWVDCNLTYDSPRYKFHTNLFSISSFAKYSYNLKLSCKFDNESFEIEEGLYYTKEDNAYKLFEILTI